MTENFSDKLAMITGASSGIGEEISLLLNRYRLSLFLVGRNEKKLKKLTNNTINSGHSSYFKVDLSIPEELNSLFHYMRENNIEPDILIHCAGTFQYSPISETSDEMIDENYRINFRAPYIITRELLEGIKKKKGQIIFINSTAVKFPKSNVSSYASFKSALRTFAEVLHHEVYSYGVRVSTIFPGRVATPMQEKVNALEGAVYSPEKYLKPETVADAVNYLLNLPPGAEINELTIRPTPY